jgi:hypothetical protein
MIADIVQLAASSALVGFTFADRLTLRWPGLPAIPLQPALGVVGILLFGLGVISLRMNWGAVAAEHAQSAATLSQVKSRLRELRTLSEPERSDEYARYVPIADALVNRVRPIPNRDFLSLKARHRAKVRLSQMVDQYPGTSLFVLTLRLWMGRASQPNPNGKGEDA